MASPPSEVGTVDNGSDKAPASGKTSGKRKATDPPAPRAPNWAHSELKGALTVALTHWAHYRGSRTHDKTRRTGDGLVAAFVAATGAASRAAARTRSAVSVDRKLKDTRTKFVAARAQLRKTGLSTSHREDILIKFGGAELYALAREAFKTSSVANESTGREPVALGGPAPPAYGALEKAAGVGDGIPDAPGRVSVLVSAAEAADTAGEGGAVADNGAGDTLGDGSGTPSASDGEQDTPKAVDILAAAEAHKISKKAKKASTSAAVSEYLHAKNERERVIFAERHNGGHPGSGQAANSVNDNDIRVAVIDMIRAITEKARRQ